MSEVRCARRTQFVIDGEVIEIHCRSCSLQSGLVVMHRWCLIVIDGKAAIGERLADRTEHKAA